VWKGRGNIGIRISSEMNFILTLIRVASPVREYNRFHRNKITPKVVSNLPQLLIAFQA
jgi:hypothetical protein